MVRALDYGGLAFEEERPATLAEALGAHPGEGLLHEHVQAAMEEHYLRAGCSRWWAVASLSCSRPFRQASQARSLAESGSSMFCRAVVRPWASHQRSNSTVVYSRSWRGPCWLMIVPPRSAVPFLLLGNVPRTSYFSL